MAQNVPTADELRKVAEYLEESAADTAVTPDASPPLAVGDAQNFPREEPNKRAIGQGSVFAQEETRRAGARLLELAAISDAGGEVTPAMVAPLQPYVDAYRTSQP